MGGCAGVHGGAAGWVGVVGGAGGVEDEGECYVATTAWVVGV